MTKPATPPQHHQHGGSSLQVGDPLVAPASFARFVMPFAYRLRPLPEAPPNNSRCYKKAGRTDWLHGPDIPATDDGTFLDLARRRYFTHETADVLFTRAHWFILREPGTAHAVPPTHPASRPSPRPEWREIHLPRSEHVEKAGQYSVAFRPPALVLFEMEHSCPDDQSHDILQIGMLVIEAYYPDAGPLAPSLADILAFHEVFRHTRRPFFQHEKQNPLIERIAGQWPLIPQANPPGGDSAEEHRLYRGRWAELLEAPVETNCDGSGSTYAKLAFPTGDDHGAHPAWAVNADGRAHVAACVLVNDRQDGGRDAPVFADSPLEPVRGFGKTLTAPPQLGYWRRLLNVDAPPHNLSKIHDINEFERRWVEPRTYLRWAEYGTAYGFSSHSTMMLSTPSGKNLPPTWRHFGQMYFDQLALMLYVRSALFRFSRALSSISSRGRHSDAHFDALGKIKVRERFQALRKDFDWFTNLYRFPLLSGEQQAIEMFKKLKQAMDVEALHNEVENEVDGTHEVLELIAAQQFTRLAMLLSMLGVIGVLMGMVQTALAWASVPAKLPEWTNPLLLVAIGLIFGIALFCCFIFAFLKWGRWFEVFLSWWFRSRNRHSR